MTNIYIKPKSVWAFCKNNPQRVKEEIVTIAENTETGYAVTVTEEKGYPYIAVYHNDNDETEFEEIAINEPDCERTVEKAYLNYLFPVTIVDEKESIIPEEENESVLDEIYEREDQLYLAMVDFLETVLNDDGNAIIEEAGRAAIEDILDNTLMYMAETYGFQVYRPTFITDEETGAEWFVEFPYDPDSYNNMEAEETEA